MDGARVNLGMYPFEPLRPAWDELIAALHRRLPWVPATHRWDEDVHAAWRDAAVVLTQVCGGPLAEWLHDTLRPVGAFRLATPGADGHRYRSVVLATRPGVPEDFARPGVVAAANSPDSLSGWTSLVAGVVGPAGRWPGSVIWTTAHVESLRALRERRAEVAAIDATTLALLRRIDPGVAEGLHEVGHGPWIPSPPIAVRVGTSDARVAELRAALADLTADPALGEVRAQLLIDGFVALDLDDYLPVRALTPAG
jgi:ABC-type phosphate/phosphonate transport system substrate-binding protein